MDTKYHCHEELGLLRRAIAEPVRQLIVVEFDVLFRLRQALDELVALDPKRAHVIQSFDTQRDAVASLLRITREKVNSSTGTRPTLLALVCSTDIQKGPAASASQRFWKEMNLARESWNNLDAQILLCLERWTYAQALEHADHLLSWAGLRIHLLGASERPAVVDRTVLSAGLFHDYKISPNLARERWHELDQGRIKASQVNEPGEGFLRQFFIPMLEAALSLGDLVLARKTRELAQEHGQFPDEDMPRWHELNLALALAEHEADLAAEHAYKLLELAESHPEDRVRDRAMTALNNNAVLFTRTAHYALAEPFHERSLRLAEEHFGSDHPKVATALNNLGSLLRNTNRHTEAERLMRRAIAIREKSLGPDHPDVASALSNLTSILSDTNRFAEAEALIRRALEIDAKSLGPEHPNVATDLNNLAQVLDNVGRFKEAEALLRRALEIHEKNSGPNHPEVAIALSNLASVLQETGRYEEAEPLIRRALDIDERSLGADHPDVAADLNNLALLLKDTNRQKEAEPLLLRALEIREKVLGPNHPDVAVLLNNLAKLLQNTNRIEEAEPLMRRHLVILLKFFQTTGHLHPNLISALANYADLLEKMSLDKAEIQKRLLAAGIEAGFSPETFNRLIKENVLEAKSRSH